jgi:hypothetical protein
MKPCDNRANQSLGSSLLCESMEREAISSKMKIAALKILLTTGLSLGITS